MLLALHQRETEGDNRQNDVKRTGLVLMGSRCSTNGGAERDNRPQRVTYSWSDDNVEFGSVWKRGSKKVVGPTAIEHGGILQPGEEKKIQCSKVRNMT